MAKQQSTYEGLSGVFDALFTVSETNARKTKSPNSAQQLFLMSDAFAQALPAVAGQVGAFTSLQNTVEQTAYNWINAGGNLVVDKGQPLVKLNTVQQYSTVMLDENGRPIDAKFEAGVKPVQVDVNLQNVISYAKSPNDFTAKIAQGWVDQIQEVRKMKMIGGLGEAYQDAALYIAGRRAGVDGDVAAMLLDVKRANTMFSDDKSGRSTFFQGFTSGDAGKPNENDLFRIGRGEDRRDAVYAQALTMIGGELDRSKRMSAAAEIEAALRANTATHEVYNTTTNAWEQKRLTMNQIFDGVLADPSHAQYGQKLLEARTSMGKVIDNISDPRLKTELQAWLFNAGPDGFEQFAARAAKGTIQKGKSEGDIASFAMGSLAQAHANAGNTAEARKLMGFAATAQGLDGKMTIGEQLMYARSRWTALGKDLPGAFTITGLITGNSFKVLADASGGLTGFGGSSLNGGKFMDALGKQQEKLLRAQWQAQFGGMTNPAISLEDFLKRHNNFGTWGRPVDPLANFLQSKRVQDSLGNTPYNLYGGAQIRDFGLLGNSFKLSGNANGMQKLFYSAYTFSPWQMVQGALNGSLFDRMAWIGTNYGRDLANPSRMGQFAINMLNNKGYQRIVQLNRYGQYIVRAPILLVNKVIERGMFAIKSAMKFAMSGIMKLMTRIMGKAVAALISQVLKRVIDAATGGLAILYDIVNTLTFGLLDKLVGKAIKAVLDLIIMFIVGFLMLLTICGLNIGEWGNPSNANLNSDNTFPPDAGYQPQERALPDLSSFVNITTGSINPADYEPFNEGDCPFLRPINCSQGPYGTYSHGCSDFGSSQLPIDVGTGGGGAIYAPVNGRISLSGDYSCGDGTPTIGNIFEFTGDDGVLYGFYHSTAVAPAGTRVSKGDLIGAMTTSVPESECWTGPHIHAYVSQGGTQLNSLEAYRRMCGNFSCGSGESNSCGR